MKLNKNTKGVLSLKYLVYCFALLSVFSRPSFAGRKYDQLKTREERVEYLEKKIQNLLVKVPREALCHDENQFVLDRQITALNSIYQEIRGHLSVDQQIETLKKQSKYYLLREAVAKERGNLDWERKKQIESGSLTEGEKRFLETATSLSTDQFYSEFYKILKQREKERMEKTPPVLGLSEKFSTVEADPNPGLEYAYSPLIKTAHEKSLSKEKTPYDIYFEHERSLGVSDQSQVPFVRRVTGYTFVGNKKSPDQVRKDQGFLGYAFEGAASQSLSPEKLSPEHYFENGKDEAFRSSSTSPNVAKKFATKSENEGYVYVILANRGIDATDKDHVKNDYDDELEVTIPGSIPWGEVVGYRKVEVDMDNNPQFTGPIFFRDGLKEKDPKAYEKIRRSLSLQQGGD